MEKYSSIKKYVVTNLEEAKTVYKKNVKRVIFHKILLFVNIFTLHSYVQYNKDSSWETMLLNFLTLSGIYYDIKMAEESRRSWTRMDRLEVRHELSKINENGGTLEDGRNYVVNKIERLTENNSLQKFSKLFWAMMAANTFVFLGRTIGIFPYQSDFQKLMVAKAYPIIAMACCSQFILTSANIVNNEQRMDELNTTLELDDISRNRKKGNNNEK